MVTHIRGQSYEKKINEWKDTFVFLIFSSLVGKKNKSRRKTITSFSSYLIIYLSTVWQPIIRQHPNFL